MPPDIQDLKTRCAGALGDDFLRGAVRYTTERLSGKKRETTAAFGDWESLRDRGRDIRKHTIENLDHYLDLFTKRLEENGAIVHFAADAAEARGIFLDIAQSKKAKLVAKSKSMVSEEIGLNHALEAAGVRVVETDLGEWIVQLARETPSHMVIPAIHKNREQIKKLFEAEGGETLDSDTKTLAAFARRKMRETFQQADIGVTGCNFGIAESGAVVLFSNEGNARMVSTLPRTQVVMMGMERLLPSWADLETMANLLPRSATGQKLTVYMTGLQGPRRAGEIDGPEEMHVIVLDNGRSKMLGDPEFQEALHCIRCAACLNVCPVYRQIGGHAYGAVYSGPIGAVVGSFLGDVTQETSELANASSLCSACWEACPVKIPLHDMLVHLRRRNVEAGRAERSEEIAFGLFGKTAASERLYETAAGAGRWIQLHMTDQKRDPKEAPRGLENVGPIAGWTRHRALPKAPKKSFRQLWSDREKRRGT